MLYFCAILKDWTGCVVFDIYIIFNIILYMVLFGEALRWSCFNNKEHRVIIALGNKKK